MDDSTEATNGPIGETKSARFRRAAALWAYGANIMNKNSYRNGALTVIALSLGILALGQGPNRADAQISHAGQQVARPEGGGLISAAEQRKQIMHEMRLLRRQVEQMNAMLRGGLSVRVTEMPEIRLPEGG